MRKIFLIAILFLFGGDVFSQNFFSIEDGLADNQITTIYKDSYGFLWIGTPNGLNCFDGYMFKLYQHLPNDSTSISCNYITGIVENEKEDLWVSTNEGGLNHYVRKKDNFIRFSAKPELSNSLINNGIVGLKLIGNKLFMGHWLGASILDLESMQFENYVTNPEGVWEYATHCFTADEEYIWLATKKQGVLKVSQKDENIESFRLFPKTEGGMNRIGSIETYDDKVFVGGGKGEIFTISKKDSKIDVVRTPKGRWIQKMLVKDSLLYFTTIYDIYSAPLDHPEGMENQIKNLNIYFPNYIDDIYFDNEGVLWSGIQNHGVAPVFENFKGINSVLLHEINIPNGELKQLYEDKLNNLWVISNNLIGILERKQIKNQVKTLDNRWLYLPEKKSNLSFRYMFQGQNLDYWFMYTDELIRLNYKTGEYESYLFEGSNRNPNAEKGPDITVEIEGEIFVNAGDLYKFDFSIGEFSRQFTSEDTLILKLDFSNVNFSYFDKHHQRLWYHHQEYFEMLDFNNQEYSRYKYRRLPGDKSFSTIQHKVTDQNHKLWFASDQGLYSFDPVDTFFNYYNEDSGLTHPAVSAVNIDEKGRIWASSFNGITILDPESGETLRLFRGNGLGTNGFMTGMFITNSKGWFVLGGMDRILFIEPNEFSFDQKTNARLLFTKIQSQKKEKLLEVQPSLSKMIRLPYNDNSVYIEFALVTLLDAEKSRYYYRIKNESENWINLDYQRSLSLSNMQPGRHELEIKAIAPNGIEVPEPTSLSIIIVPPWYKTIFFKILALVLISALAFFINWMRIRRISKYNQQLEAQVIERTTEIQHQKEELEAQAEELRITSEELSISNKTKDKFFSIIAHDLKNPFQGIMNFSNILETNFYKLEDKEKLKFISHVKESSHNAYQLLDNLLQWSMTQTRNMKYEPTGIYVSNIVSKTIDLLILNADNKKIIIENKTNKDHIVYADMNMVTTVLRNIISNAIKFTPEKGKIEINSVSIENQVEIHIKDSGIGIKQEAIQSLFAIEKVHSTKGTSGESGTGLGLSLCKDFMEMNKGSIRVESKIGKGSNFIINLPVFKGDINEQIENHSKKILQETEKDEIEPGQILNPTNEIETKIDEEQFKNRVILIVEDNYEIRESIKNSIEENYKVFEAENGKIGWDVAVKEIPDFIISDVMMPEMDGFELSAKLKEDERTSHIPIIMLTSRNSNESQIKGLETGVDDYITKPIDSSVLMTRIKNILYNRKKMQNRFALDLIVQPKEVTTNTTDEGFLKRAILLVDENISNPDFSVQAFTREIGMSRTLLYRKMNQLTGKSINEFIQTIRFKKAAVLLKDPSNNISDVAYKVGFNNPVSFTRAFSREFGKSPSDWLKDNISNESDSSES